MSRAPHNRGYFERIVAEAHEAGHKAAVAAKPTPMVVTDADLITGLPIPGATRYHVPEGACGFAWIKLKGNTKFGRWMKATKRARPGYPTGLTVWVSDYNQSVERKLAYAEAYAAVLRKYGIDDAYADSRLD